MGNILLEYFSLCLEQLSHGSPDILEWAAVQTSGLSCPNDSHTFTLL